MNREGTVIETGRISKLLSFRGLERTPIEIAHAGDIVAIAGLEDATVADTIAVPELDVPLPAQPIDPPTLAMTFSINDSPLAGREGTKLTSRMVRDRLMREAEGNVAIHITETAEKDAFEVAGRGELQLGVLIETMRREGFELSISRPRVLYRKDEKTGERLEPIEEVQIDVDEEFVGSVVDSMNQRKSEMVDMRPSGGGKTRIIFLTPSRGLIGYHGQFLTETRGTGIMSRVFHSYGLYRGAVEGRRNGVLISNGDGEVAAYALNSLEERGTLFVGPGAKVYLGMIVGENNRENDLEVNPLKAKQLTNFRASGKEEAIRLTPPKVMTLEQAISYIQDDERVEVTPKFIRIRKAILCPNDRKRAERAAKD
jgi:GTP-binding protein